MVVARIHFLVAVGLIQAYFFKAMNRIFDIPFLISRSSFLKRFYLFIYRQRGREGEREGEKH